MVAKWTFLIALVGVLGLAWQASARADSKALVQDYLVDRGATGYTITAVNADYLADSFPGTDFFAVIFRQYPILVLPPKGLSSSNVFLVQNQNVTPLLSTADLEDFFFDELALVEDEAAAADAGLSWLRLTEVFSQDGFYTFSAPNINVMATPNGEFIVTGSVTVTAGGRGSIKAELVFDAFDGSLEDVSETRNVRPGVRPICQATKLLDADQLVRRMAEQDILVMGKSAKGYLDEQRAKAKPELKAAIDRIWKRIVEEGW
jgi:hypothetical protein